MRTGIWLVALAASGLFSSSAFADDTPPPPSPWQQGAALFDQGKLLATGGVSAVEGEGGGGLAGWALISGYGTRDGISVNAHDTYVGLSDYQLVSPGVAIRVCSTGWSFPMRGLPSTPKEATGAALGLGQGFTFHQNIYGAKLKLVGDAVYDQDSWLPQIAIGVQHKENDRGAVIAAVGGKGHVGTDFYPAPPTN